MPYNIEYHREWNRKYYLAHKEEIRERTKRWHKENPDIVRESRKKSQKKYATSERGKIKIEKYYKEYMKTYIRPESTKEKAKVWIENNYEKVRKIANRSEGRARKELSSGYITGLIVGKSKLLRNADIPQELVELQRLKVMAERMLKSYALY